MQASNETELLGQELQSDAQLRSQLEHLLSIAGWWTSVLAGTLMLLWLLHAVRWASLLSQEPQGTSTFAYGVMNAVTFWLPACMLWRIQRHIGTLRNQFSASEFTGLCVKLKHFWISTLVLPGFVLGLITLWLVQMIA